ncbi:MAG: hypothetical protein Q7N87_05130 [Candidatus Uhrbacteria bacterium]|nr:hypothetical protein [Candidatus Uhrbacteria bacterium]
MNWGQLFHRVFTRPAWFFGTLALLGFITLMIASVISPGLPERMMMAVWVAVRPMFQLLFEAAVVIFIVGYGLRMLVGGGHRSGGGNRGGH